MVFVEGDDYRALRRPGDDPAQFRSPVRSPRTDVPDIAVVDGLVAWYRFADDSNTAIDYTAELDDDRFADTTAFDGTVNGASFVPNGGVRDVVSGANPSGAYDFDGVDDEINAPEQAFTKNSPQTVLLWVKLDSSVNGQRFFSTDRRNSDTPRGIVIQQDDSGNFAIFSDETRVDGFNNVIVGEFVQLGFVLEGGDIFSVFNGTKSLLSSGTFTDSDNPVQLGGDPQRGVFADVVLDDVRIYNRALSGSEINQIYENTDPDQ
jgi:hypothetical protein